MEQIRQILNQLALHLELNIAMCDKIADLETRLTKLEKHYEAQKSRLDGLYRLVSEANYVASSEAYYVRKASMRDSYDKSKNSIEN